MIKSFIRLASIAAAIAVVGVCSAAAADIPTKAPVASKNPLFSGYPYVGQGFYFGLNTMGGGGNVSAVGAGVNPNSTISNEIGVGGTVGYAWASTNVFYAVEAIFDIRNFNGNAAGLAFSGPASFEQRIKIGTPLSNFLSMFPSLGLPTVPPFPALPGGQVATNVHPYLMAGVHEDDVSVNFGLASNKEWRVAPSIGVGAMGQLANGIAVDTWVETVFPESGTCVGPIGSAQCGKIGQQIKVGFGVYY